MDNYIIEMRRGGGLHWYAIVSLRVSDFNHISRSTINPYPAFENNGLSSRSRHNAYYLATCSLRYFI